MVDCIIYRYGPPHQSDRKSTREWESAPLFFLFYAFSLFCFKFLEKGRVLLGHTHIGNFKFPLFYSPKWLLRNCPHQMDSPSVLRPPPWERVIIVPRDPRPHALGNNFISSRRNDNCRVDDFKHVGGHILLFLRDTHRPVFRV